MVAKQLALAELPKCSSFFGCIVQTDNFLQVLVVLLGEGKSSLLFHPLHLSHFSDGLLKLLHSRSVVLNVVLLDLLYVMVTLGTITPLKKFPCKVTKQAKARDAKDGRPETQTVVCVTQHSIIFPRNIDSWCNCSIGREPKQPKHE